MATVIDALVITLGIDPKGVKSGAKETKSALKQTSDEATKTAKEMEARGKQAAEFFSKIRNEALALLAVFTAGVGIKNFVENTIVGAASLGRMSQNLDMSTERLSAWQRVAEDAGGTAEGMNAQLKESQKTISQFKMGQSTESLQWFFRMGGKTTDLKDGNTYLMARSKIIADLFKVDPGKAQLVASQMGISDDQFNLLKQGPAAVQAQVDAMEKLSAISAEDARQADELRKKFLNLERTLTLVGMKIVEALMPAFDQLIVYLQGLANWVASHKDDITAWIDASVKSVIAFGKEVNKAAESVGGWKNVLITLAAIKVLSMVSPLLQLASGLGAVGGALGALGGAAAVTGLGTLAVLAGISIGKIKDSTEPGHFVGRNAGAKIPVPLRESDSNASLWDSIKSGTKSFFSTEKGHFVSRTNGAEQQHARAALDYFIKQGWTSAQAAGIVGSIEQESTVDPTSRNKNSGAYGIGQWLGSRVTDFKAWSGHDLEGSSMDDQLAFMQYELTQGKEQAAGRKLRAANTAAEAAAVHANAYERPGAAEANIAQRQAYANSLYAASGQSAATSVADMSTGAQTASNPVSGASTSTSSSEVNVNGPITIHTMATDAPGIAQGIGPAIAKYGFVAQANTGLN